VTVVQLKIQKITYKKFREKIRGKNVI